MIDFREEVRLDRLRRQVKMMRGKRLDVDLPGLYPKQKEIKAASRRFNVLDIGRRAGKTYLGINLAAECALEGNPVGWFAPTYKYVLEVWQDLTRIMRPVASKINATERRIELHNGGVIEVWTLEKEDAGRSRKYKKVIVDEAAIAPNLKTAWEQAIMPTLTDLRGDAWFLSTPKGLNYFYDLFKRGQDETQPDWISWQLPSTVNPFLPPEEIELQRLQLPQAVFLQEYLAEFLQNEGAVFRNIDACLFSEVGKVYEHAGHLLVAGVDWARVHDFTAISVFCCECRREVYLDRFNQIGWEFQRARIKSIFELWKPKYVVLESNSIGSPNLEALRKIVPLDVTLSGFEMTSKSKQPLIQALALAFEKTEAQWLPDPVARHELISYEAKITESGFTKYSAPEGGWDDTVIARALVWRAARPWIPTPKTFDQQVEAKLNPGYRNDRAPEVGTWEYDGWAIRRDYEKAKIEKEIKGKTPDLDNLWEPASPLSNTADDPWK